MVASSSSFSAPVRVLSVSLLPSGPGAARLGGVSVVCSDGRARTCWFSRLQWVDEDSVVAHSRGLSWFELLQHAVGAYVVFSADSGWSSDSWFSEWCLVSVEMLEAYMERDRLRREFESYKERFAEARRINLHDVILHKLGYVITKTREELEDAEDTYNDWLEHKFGE